MVNFKSGREEYQVLTICKNGKDFKFEIETPQDFLNAFQFMFEAEAVGKGKAAPLLFDEAWSFQLPDRAGDSAIEALKVQPERFLKCLN